MPFTYVAIIACLLSAFPAIAQDSTQAAPRFALELLLGGGGRHEVKVQTAPDHEDRMDLAGWFHLGIALDGRLRNAWSWRASFTYEIAGWERTGGGPTGSTHPDGDRVGIGLGVARQVLGTPRHQISIAGELRGVLGMDVRADVRTDTAYTTTSFQYVQMFYHPALVPRLSAAWRYRWRANKLGLVVRAGIEHFAYRYQRSELSSGLVGLPDGLQPLTGDQHGFAYVVSVGLAGWP